MPGTLIICVGVRVCMRARVRARVSVCVRVHKGVCMRVCVCGCVRVCSKGEAVLGNPHRRGLSVFISLSTIHPIDYHNSTSVVLSLEEPYVHPFSVYTRIIFHSFCQVLSCTSSHVQFSTSQRSATERPVFRLSNASYIPADMQEL